VLFILSPHYQVNFECRTKTPIAGSGYAGFQSIYGYQPGKIADTDNPEFSKRQDDYFNAHSVSIEK
jgi:hypothetical protein